MYLNIKIKCILTPRLFAITDVVPRWLTQCHRRHREDSDSHVVAVASSTTPCTATFLFRCSQCTVPTPGQLPRPHTGPVAPWPAHPLIASCAPSLPSCRCVASSAARVLLYRSAQAHQERSRGARVMEGWFCVSATARMVLWFAVTRVAYKII